MYAERGKIHSPARAAQLRDYSALRFENITPTDIDGFIDFGNRFFVFFEFKLAGVQLPYGQRLALERLVDACEAPNRRSIALIGEHNNRTGPIEAAGCRLVECRWQGRWRYSASPMTIGAMMGMIWNAYKEMQL